MSNYYSPESLPPEAISFFDSVFPDVVMLEPYAFDDIRDKRLETAGLGMAEMILRDGLHCFATYVQEVTAHTNALMLIYTEEGLGVLPIGTHERAIDSIISGEFEREFGRYLNS